jgi:hypothetical protein
MHRDNDDSQGKQRPGGDDRREWRPGGTVQGVEKDRHSQRRRAPAQMRRIDVRCLVGPRNDAAEALAGGEQGDRDPAAEPRHRPCRRKPEQEIRGRLGNEPVVAQHHDEGDDQAGRSQGMGSEDHKRAQRLVEAARRRTRGDPARPINRDPGHGADGDERRGRRQHARRIVGRLGDDLPRSENGADRPRLRRHRRSGAGPEARIEQIGAVGEQAIGENLPAARIDTVGEFVGAAGEEPRLLHGAVELGLRRRDAAAFRGDRRVLGRSAGRRGRAELRQAVGDLLEAGFEHRRTLAHLVAQRRQALSQREKLVFGMSVLEALRDVVKLGLEGLEVCLRRPLLRKRRGRL